MENQARVWDEIALKWNEFREVPSSSVVEFLKDKVGKILDLGCGSGRNFSAISKQSEVYGVDFSKEMLKYAEEKAKSLKLKASFEKSKASKLSFEDNFFDSIICVAVLHCIPSKEERVNTIKEIYRTLKPKSKALISVWGKNSPRLKNKPKECFVTWTVKNDKPSRKGEKEIKQERYTYIYDLEELRKEALGVGFAVDRAWEERNVNLIVRK
jgi:ubiquinone/menaquinone biosynthesis C-methylase UbiE